MKRLTVRSCVVPVTAVLCLTAALRLSAQSTAPASAGAPKDDEPTIVLSPFVVEATEDSGYTAKDTLAGTRIRTELKDVGASVSVVTQKFLQDTNSRSIEQLLVYTTNTEVAGQGGNFVGQGDGALLTKTNSDQKSGTTTRVRGLTDADNTRDFFLTDVPWDSYNVGRVDLQRGANSVLFGIGSPAGIVNSSLNQANIAKSSNKVENQLGSFGTVRFSADFNRVLLKNELALRVDLLKDSTKYRQDPAFKKDERIYAALRWDPAFLNNDSMRTSIRANFEKGHIRANDPISTPPNDAITPFFTHLAKTVRPDPANPANSTAGLNFLSVTADASQIGNNGYFGPAGGRVFDGVLTAIDGGVVGATIPTAVKNWPNVSVGVPALQTNTGYRGIVTYDQVAGPFSDIGAYKAKSLTDATIYDFYNNLLDGPNKGRFNDFTAFSGAFSQTFLSDKIGYELSYDHQKAKWGYHTFLATDANSITVDIMRSFADGSINPNFGRPMTLSGGGSTQGEITEQTRKVFRATVFGDINFADLASTKDSTLGRILGRHTLTGLYTTDERNILDKVYKNEYLSPSFVPANGAQVSQAQRDNILAVYLGGVIAGNTAHGINLVGIKDVISPPASSTINYYNNVTNAWQTIGINTVNNLLVDERNKTYVRSSKSKTKINSGAVVWQAHMFDDILVPMVGIRKDTSDFFGAGNPPVGSEAGLVNPYNPSWTLPGSPISVSGTSRTYSLVARLPKSLRSKLPGNLDVSPFYNQSENFQPDASRKDLFGDPIGNPSGKTKEYGISISLLDDKLTLKIAKYKTNVSAASLGDFGWQNYLIGAAEAWAQHSALSYKKVADTGIVDAGYRAFQSFGTTSDGHVLTWRPGPARALDGSGDAAYNANLAAAPNSYTQAQIDATWLAEKASLDAWFANPVPVKFQNAWGMNDYNDHGAPGSNGNWQTADGITVTGDTISQGTEFELSASPIKGLDISLNASKTTAQRTNLAKTYVDWIQGRWQFFQGPAGEMRIWSANPEGNRLFGPDETVRGKYGRETMAQYNLWQALLNSDVPELRPWRANLIANYSFQDGSLKGANVGGSLRWAAASVTGFPVLTKADGSHSYDVSNPYKGKSEQVFDIWLGYEWKFSKKVKWRTQLNVRNVFATDRFLPVTVQPDGSAAAMRIAEPRTWTITNTLEF